MTPRHNHEPGAMARGHDAQAPRVEIESCWGAHARQGVDGDHDFALETLPAFWSVDVDIADVPEGATDSVVHDAVRWFRFGTPST